MFKGSYGTFFTILVFFVLVGCGENLRERVLVTSKENTPPHFRFWNQKNEGFDKFSSIQASDNVNEGKVRQASQSSQLFKQSSIEDRAKTWRRSSGGRFYLASGVEADPEGETFSSH